MVYGLFKPCCFTHVTGTCFKETSLFFNVYLNCLVDFILCPTDKYMSKVNNKKIRLIHMFKFKNKFSMPSFFCFYCDFDHSQHINIVFLVLTLNKYLSVGCENPTSRPSSFSNLSLHPIEINYDHIKCL